jgi:hypothetical protein
MTTRAGRSSEQTPRAVVESGWLPDKKQTQKFKTHQRVPMFAQAGRHLAGTGAGKVARHWKIYEAVTGSPFDPHDQGIGDCVAHGWGLGIDFLDTIQIIQGNGEWKGKCATEIIYTGGRVEIGNGVIRRDGMHGSWAGRWCNEYGVLLRQPYLDGKYDFTTYSAAKSRKWGHNCRRCTAWGGGVPDELEPLCKLHPVKTITLVTSWEQARDAIYNGYPVAICSNQGFSERRDADGFAATEGTWYHCMLLGGIDDSGRRPGGLLINSWGTDWIEGPTRLDQPVGSFWADAEHIDSMLAQEDSFALSNYVGYPRQDLDYKLY